MKKKKENTGKKETTLKKKKRREPPLVLRCLIPPSKLRLSWPRTLFSLFSRSLVSVLRAFSRFFGLLRL